MPWQFDSVLWPSLLASVASSLAYNYFFLPPIYTFTITDPTNVAAFAFFTLVAIIVSSVAARGRTQAMAAMDRARTTESLYAFSRKLAGAGTLDDVLWATAYQTALMLKVRVVLLLPEDGKIAVKAGYPPEDILDDGHLAAASGPAKTTVRRPAPDTLPARNVWSCPCTPGVGRIGVMGIDRDESGGVLTPIGAVARCSRRRRARDRKGRWSRTWTASNGSRDDVGSALLTSISHDRRRRSPVC